MYLQSFRHATVDKNLFKEETVSRGRHCTKSLFELLQNSEPPANRSIAPTHVPNQLTNFTSFCGYDYSIRLSLS